MTTGRRRFGCIGVLLAASAAAQAADDWPMPEGVQRPPSCRRSDTSVTDPVVPWLIRRVALEDVAYHVRAGVEPDTFVRFSPDGRRLAIGTFLGRVKALDVVSGRVLWDRKIAEGMVKRIDFSPDGRTVYLGEQSMDGFLYAAEADTGKTMWRFRLADDLQTGPPPARDDVYGVYHLPGWYRVAVLRCGDIVALGVHAWGDYRKPDTITRLSRVYRLSPEGRVKWAFPPDGPAPLTLMYADVDREGRRVAVLADRGGGNAPPDLPYKPGSVYALDGATGQVVGGHTFEPLRPHFKDVQFWQSVSVSARGDAAAVGLYDGRTFVFDLDPVRPKFTHDFGAPLVVSGVPVSAISTYTHFGPDGSIYFQTGDSSVPFAAMSQHVVSPPGPHPNANTIHVVSAEGKVAWRYRSGHKYQGFWTSADGRWMMTCVRRETADGALDAGAMLFDTHRPGGGTSKLAYYYQVEGLSFFHADMAQDGSAIAIIEIPYRRPDTGQIVGAYQVHVVR